MDPCNLQHAGQKGRESFLDKLKKFDEHSYDRPGIDVSDIPANDNDVTSDMLNISDMSDNDLSISEKEVVQVPEHDGSLCGEKLLDHWECKSHGDDEIELDNDLRDVVSLIEFNDGTLVLKYELYVDEDITIPVDSIEEAMSIIEEDNATTEELYPGNPDIKWKNGSGTVVTK
ncbi:MAG: hypothetical protein ACXQTE_00230 [Methanosarcinaceae archaeon]